MSVPPASIVIPSRNRPDLLEDAVRAILQGQHVPAELIIVDQSSTPHPWLASFTGERDCQVRYLWTASVGVSRARNAGAAAAHHELLAFIDDDILVSSTWFLTLVQALVEAGPRSIVCGQVRATETATPGGFAPSLKIAQRRATYEGRVGADVLYSNNAALPRLAVEAVGGFDVRFGPGSRFPTAEDNDLGFRLLEAGYRILYVPEAVVYHRAWRSPQDYLPLLWNYGRGQGAFYAKHSKLHDRYMLGRLTRHAVRHAMRGARHAHRNASEACGEFVYVTGLLFGAAQWVMTEGGVHR